MRSTETNQFQLHNAALNGNTNKVEELLRHDPDAFKRMLVTVDTNNNLPLDRAAPRGHFHIVKLLVSEHSKNTNLAYKVHNKQKYTPLLSAVRWYLKVLDGSYKNGIYVGVFNNGSTRDEDYKRIIKLLIESFPHHINYLDNKDFNALYYVIHHLADATKTNNIANMRKIKWVAECLIQAGINLDTHNSNEKSPRMLAKERGVLHIIESIENEYKTVKSNKITFINACPPQIKDASAATPTSQINNLKPIIYKQAIKQTNIICKIHLTEMHIPEIKTETENTQTKPTLFIHPESKRKESVLVERKNAVDPNKKKKKSVKKNVPIITKQCHKERSKEIIRQFLHDKEIDYDFTRTDAAERELASFLNSNKDNVPPIARLKNCLFLQKKYHSAWNFFCCNPELHVMMDKVAANQLLVDAKASVKMKHS